MDRQLFQDGGATAPRPRHWIVAFKDIDPSGGVAIDMSRKDIDGVKIPAMPKKLFDDDALHSWLVSNYRRNSLFESSLATLYNVNTVPPKIDMAEILSPSLRARLKNSRDGISRLTT
jgi:hypothetical protein